MNRLTLVLLSSLTLAACGGGGGGGGGTSSSDDDSSNNNGGGSNQGNQQEDQAFTQQQNIYLPLIEGKGWVYDVTGQLEDSTITATEYSSDSFSLPVTFENGAEDIVLSQVFSSNSTAIEIRRFDFQNLAINLGVLDVTINSLVFDSNDLPTVTTANTLLQDDVVTTLESSLGNYPLDSTFSYTNLPTTVNIDGWGEMIGRRIITTLDIEDTILTVDVNIALSETTIYVPGVGPVQREVKVFLDGNTLGVPDYEVQLTLSNLAGIPEPVVYTLTGATAIAPANIEIRANDGNNVFASLSPEDYDVLNDDEIAAISWVSVAEATNGLTYEVTVNAPDPLPTETSSEVVYVSDDNGDTQLPVNVTLIVD